MSDKIIGDVMDLVQIHIEARDAYREEQRSKNWDAYESSLESIRAKLREVLERKPMQEGEIFNWWRGENGLEDHNMCKLQDFSEVVRAVEKRHNIK